MVWRLALGQALMGHIFQHPVMLGSGLIRDSGAIPSSLDSPVLSDANNGLVLNEIACWALRKEIQGSSKQTHIIHINT